MKENPRPADRYAYLAAIEHFPNRKTAIRRLMARDEAFRAICEELSATKAVLAGHATLREADNQEHRNEQLERVGCLVGEILAVLLSEEATTSREP